MIAVNRQGDVLPVLSPVTAGSNAEVNVDGTSAHAESIILSQGIYRLAVITSVDDAGLKAKINAAGVTDTATATTGMFMPNGCIEYVAIEEGSQISVINGNLNVIKVI